MNFSNRSMLGQLDENFLDRLLGIGETRQLAAGETLCTAGDEFDGAWLIAEGRLLEQAAEGPARELTAGDVLDELQLLTAGRREGTVVALEPSRLLLFAPDRFRALVAGDDPLLETLSTLASERLRDAQLGQILLRLFGPLEDAVRDRLRQQIDWLELEPGETLFRQADPGDALYALIDGRLAAFAEGETGSVFLNEILPGETIGEIAIVTGAHRSATVKATRRSLLVRLARSDFDAIAAQHPIVYKAFAQVLVTWLQRSHDGHYRQKEAREIALIAHREEPGMMERVTRGLADALSLIGSTLRLSSSGLRDIGARNLFDVTRALTEPLYHPANTRFRLWLDEQKRRHAFIVYETDGDGSVWDRLCLDRAHEVLVVAEARADPQPGAVERLLQGAPITARRLALVHRDGEVPTNTGQWLRERTLTGHHHLRLERAGDFQRLARFLAGKAVGLVLAGGGARGFAHVGIIRALHERGIPIDLIGGTSSGGMCALMYAMDTDPALLELRNQRDWVARKPWSRYAPPVLSILDHTKWDRIFEAAFQQRAVEDLWIPAFSVSCNLDTGQTVVHDTGPAWKAARATASLPVLLAPVLYDGHGHVDGGVVNNLPTWRLLRERIPGFRRPGHHHTVPKVIMRLATMQDLAAFDARAQLADFMFLPPVGSFSMTGFESVDRIIACGYAYGLERLQRWADDDAFVQRLGSAGIRLRG
ncbi:MAG: cyclic nucleotide-binding domain-containing protein [Xanthomonadales bacterium]|nr:cyclic nucleotide-binding domain-containing protein [Xanthomonadales bacterium]